MIYKRQYVEDGYSEALSREEVLKSLEGNYVDPEAAMKSIEQYPGQKLRTMFAFYWAEN